MCGIFAVFTNNNALDLDKAKCSLHKLSHRGPDNQSHWTNKSSAFLGHARLSIIDVSESANQPFLSKDGKHAIIFNGEIYNYKALKQSLRYGFATNSDTEVILAGYLTMGVSFFKQLRGIYAFAIVELGEQPKVVVARDPSGIKPLYYSFGNGELIFASEIKALLPDGCQHRYGGRGKRRLLTLGRKVDAPNRLELKQQRIGRG